MWLEGALQNRWSVSKMQLHRSETLGKLPGEQAPDVELATIVIDDDFPTNSERRPSPLPGDWADTPAGPRPEGPDFGDEAHLGKHGRDKESVPSGAAIYADESDFLGGQQESIEFVRPFASLAELPEDLADAFDAFKLAILHHKSEGWERVACDDVLASLEALKRLATAP
jgi:hypothetical protein